MFVLRLPLIASSILLSGIPIAHSRDIAPMGQTLPLRNQTALKKRPAEAKPLSFHIPPAQLASLAAALAPGPQPKTSKFEMPSGCRSTNSVICFKDGKMVPNTLQLTDERASE